MKILTNRLLKTGKNEVTYSALATMLVKRSVASTGSERADMKESVRRRSMN